MSRVGKLPIPVHSETKVDFDAGYLTVSGKLGELKLNIPESVVLEIKESDDSDDIFPDCNRLIHISLGKDSKNSSLWGTTNKLVRNAITGVSQGFEKRLTIKGTGYKSSVSGNSICLSLGYSHDIIYAFSDEVQIKTEGPELVVFSHDKQKVGQVCGEIIAFRPVEPYKGKGIYVSGSAVRRKEGKKK